MYYIKDTLTSAFFIVFILLLLSLLALTPLISMIMLAAIFAYVIRPISLRMEPYLKFKSITVFVAMILVIIPIIVLLVIVINGLIQNVPSIISFAKSLNLTSLNNLNVENYTFVKHYIPSNFYPYLNSAINAINSEVTDILRGVLDYVVKILESIPLALIQLFIFFASTFYFVRDGDKLWEICGLSYTIEKKTLF